MKNKILLVMFLFSLLVPVGFVSAFGEYAPGGSLNPYNVQITQDPLQAQRNANTQKENSLKSSYGITNYYSCYNTYSSSCGITADIGNPYTQNSCLNLIQYCLERKAMQSSQNTITCPSGTGLRNGSCISQDKICEMDLGTNYKWDGTMNSNGSANCVVKTINNKPDGNVLDQICQETFGEHSIYTGNTDKGRGGNTGGCGCEADYYWVLGMTTCGNENTPREEVKTISTPKTIQTITPVDKKVVEVKNTPKEVETEVKEVGHKSFWSRFFNWLGF